MTNEPFGTVEQLRLWSVTTLLKMGLGTGPGLINWIVDQVATAAIDKRATVEAMLRDNDRDGAIKYLKDQRWKKTDKAKVRGTDVHKAAEAIALGQEPTIVPGTEAYVEQLARWIERFAPTFLMAEAPVYNPAEFYAGTLDGVIELDGKRLLIDYKTTEHAPDSGRSRPPYDEVALQLVAYARATEVGVIAEQRYDGKNQRYYMYDPTQAHEPMPEVDGALCIVVSPFDCTAVPVRITDAVWDAFLHVREAAQWREFDSKTVFGPALTLREEVVS